MWNARLDETQAGIKIARRNINNLRNADDTPLMAESKEELKSLKESERGGWKSWLKTQHSKNEDHGIQSTTLWQIDGETVETVTNFPFWGSKMTADGDCSHEIKTLAPWKKSHGKPRQHVKRQRHYFANKGPSIQSYGFSSGHVWMWELDYKERRAPKNWCFWTVVLENTLESPVDCKEIQSVHPKGNQFWIFIGRTDAEAETPILWPPDTKNGLFGKDPEAGKDLRREEKGRTEDETVGWHHRLNGHKV